MIKADEIYKRLYDAYGQPRWWSDDAYVVLFQSILVQNTSWSSVENVTVSLGGTLSPQAVLRLKPEQLEALIRPCGFCLRKADTIRRVTQWYGTYDFDAWKVIARGQTELRKELLAIKGIGPETADVMLVYAFHKPSFVIDAYTRRFLERLGFSFGDDEEIHVFFEKDLERDYQLYGWFHWLILTHGIRHCGKTPSCGGCVFADICSSFHNWQKREQ